MTDGRGMEGTLIRAGHKGWIFHAASGSDESVQAPVHSSSVSSDLRTWKSSIVSSEGLFSPFLKISFILRFSVPPKSMKEIH